MRVLWEDHPGDPPWWSLRLGLPQSPTGCDRLQFDLYVESSDNQAGLNVFLYEADEDRWIAWQAALATLEPHRWHHVDVPRDQMRMWLLGNQKPEWDRVRGLAFESAHGKATFCVDAVRLVGSSPHQTLELFSTADDGLHPRPDWPAATVAPVPPPGTVYFPFDGDRLGFEELRDSPVALDRLLGGVGTPVSGYSPELPVTSRFLGEHGVPLLHYGTFGEGCMRYLTRRQAWDVNALGRSLNHLPVSMTTWDGRHSISLAHPAVTEALNQKAEALLRAGLGVWMVVDYTFPWWETLWGYSDAMLAAYRDDLVGRDEGLHLRDGDRRQVVHLAEYFQAFRQTLASAQALRQRLRDLRFEEIGM
jgi:PAS domain-containing protein